MAVTQKDLEKQKDITRDIGRELRDQLETTNKLDDAVNRILQVKELSLAAAKSVKKLEGDITEEDLKQAKLDGESLDLAKELVENTKQRLEGVRKLIAGARLLNVVAKANPYVAVLAAVIAIGAALNSLNKFASETAKEFGVTRSEALKIEASLKAATFNFGGIKITSEEARESFNAIRSDLGGINSASVNLVRAIADTSNQLGVSGGEFTKILTLQESISDLSREQLINNAKLTKEIIRQAGVLPGDIFKDIAENTRLFAEFGKDGGGNIIKAAVSARKLGLSLNQVAGISESLLDFESSIEKQLEASLLLGRQINLDKARQLALTGDQEGMLQEVLKQVGGEAEFNELNVIQRRALADSVGVQVEELSRLVRNQGAGESAAATAGASSNAKSELEALNSIVDATRQTAGNTGMLSNIKSFFQGED